MSILHDYVVSKVLMAAMRLPTRKPENHGRELAKLGVEKRREQRSITQAQYEKLRRANVDEMRRILGMPAIQWRD